MAKRVWLLLCCIIALGASGRTAAYDQPNGKPPNAASGSGLGHHSPLSQIPPLKRRVDVVPWELFGGVQRTFRNGLMVPVFPSALLALDGRPVKLQGFVMPLDAGLGQSHFLLSSVPTTCPYCVPAGPEGLVEVHVAAPVRFTPQAILVAGRLAVLKADKYGLFYRLEDARVIDE